MPEINVNLKAVGTIRSPYISRSDAPRQGDGTVCEIEIDRQYEEGLKDLEGFSHIHVFCWFHESRDYTLIVQTPWDVETHGLFATRTPNRPSPIGYSVAELISIEDNILKVKGIDAIDGTSVIDIKPYIKNIDMKEDAVCGWTEKNEIRVSSRSHSQ